MWPARSANEVVRPACETVPAEYKQVTVLFADVVRSMHIAAALDIVRLHEIMTELVGRAAMLVTCAPTPAT